jgi:hypothetical protein
MHSRLAPARSHCNDTRHSRRDNSCRRRAGSCRNTLHVRRLDRPHHTKGGDSPSPNGSPPIASLRHSQPGYRANPDDIPNLDASLQRPTPGGPQLHPSRVVPTGTASCPSSSASPVSSSPTIALGFGLLARDETKKESRHSQHQQSPHGRHSIVGGEAGTRMLCSGQVGRATNLHDLNA